MLILERKQEEVEIIDQADLRAEHVEEMPALEHGTITMLKHLVARYAERCLFFRKQYWGHLESRSPTNQQSDWSPDPPNPS